MFPKGNKTKGFYLLYEHIVAEDDTAPQVFNPKHPRVIDEIPNLGECRDTK